MRVNKVVLSLTISALFPLVSYAGQFPVPTVEYSADSRMETGGMAMDQKLFMTRDKQRIEMKNPQAGMDSIMISRLDKKVAWNLIPAQKAYTEVNLQESEKQSGDMRSCSADFSGGTSDAVNGITARKSHGSVVCPEISYEGDFWITAEGIMVKMDVTGKSKDGTTGNFRMTLSNLKLGRQDPALFEIPDGYRSMGNMNDMSAKYQRIMEEQQKRQADAERESKRKSDEDARKKEEQDAKRKADEEARKKEQAGRDFTAKGRSGQDGSGAKGTVEDAVKSGLKSLLKW